MKQALITGTSSGLGQALAAQLLTSGWRVFGCSRRSAGLDGLQERAVDLARPGSIAPMLDDLLDGVDRLELVVLNAGILGEIRDMSDTPLDAARQVMDINVWANKVIMDWLHGADITIRQIVMISSGASVLGNRGWSGYALSKAALNMLARLYSHEFATTHISALAPGIIDTAMMHTLCEADGATFPAVERLRQARGTQAMPDAAGAAQRVIEVLSLLRERPSGSFVDLREILDPAGYAALYGSAASPPLSTR